ncbi:MAG: hypothetical protein GTO49_11010 [Anaerolineae bacterium]|nr:hypothetical protein [Anaerolineae bacterium]
MILWAANLALMMFIAGFLLAERMRSGALEVAIHRAVYEEPRSTVFGVRVRRGAVLA